MDKSGVTKHRVRVHESVWQKPHEIFESHHQHNFMMENREIEPEWLVLNAETAVQSCGLSWQ